MDFFKKHKSKMIFAVCALFILCVAFFWGGVNDSSDSSKNENAYEISTNEQNVKKENNEEVINSYENEQNADEALKDEISENVKANEENSVLKSEENTNENNEKNVKADNDLLTCTLSVRCDNAVGKTQDKASVLPKNGIVYAEKSVEFSRGESVFDVLFREMKKNKIHLEFVNTPIYNSAYIEGINNLYEFDCGSLSGWMYKVNGTFPNYGCSQYKLENGDKIEWVYTCDLGRDVGGEYSAKNGMQNEE